jgi:hypothetical protein
MHGIRAQRGRRGGIEVGRRADLVYRRTQLGIVTVGAVGAAATLLAVLAGSTGWHTAIIVVLVALVATLALFYSLTIEIDAQQLRCFFGPGVIRRRIPLHEIVAARRVRNRWYYGWGIRLTPTGWMWNVSGLDAVELALASGARFRIGTDRPDEVIRALGLVTTLAAPPPVDPPRGSTS